VVSGDAFSYLARPDLSPFDVIYVAPPQYHELWLRALRMIDARPELVQDGGQVIVQIFPKEWAEPDLAHLILLDRRQYGSTALFFFSRKE
jgi:16S rRNA (guanine966-N2)-methyltransferase